MRRLIALFALLFAFSVALAPVMAEARAGSGGSMGSRGSHMYYAPPPTNVAPGGGAPFQQSTTVPSGYGGQGYNGAYGGRGLGAGLLGGLLGFGLGSAMFGHHYGHGFGGLGFLGLLIRLAILFFIVRWVFRLVTGRRSEGVVSSGPAGAMGFGMGAPPPAASAPISIAPADYQAFEVLLKNVEAAWSNNDIGALRAFATPEMVGYFADQLAANASRGMRNIVSDVRLQQGDLAEAWHENGRDYATVAMRYSMVDATFDQGGRVVDGSATEHTTATEYWTFMRVPGGRWMLSAIQQTR